MKNIKLFSIIILMLFFESVSSQTIYVDINNGNNNNTGSVKLPVKTLEKATEIANNDSENKFTTIKIAAGIYILHDKLVFENKKYSKSGRFTLEALILPDDTAWSPGKMPVILSIAGTSKNFGFDCSLGLNIEVNHATIRGLKFLGNANPKVYYYYPVARSGKSLNDLEITQCMFVGNVDASPIQAAILAHGQKIKVKNSVFYNCKNSVVFYFADDDRSVKRINSEMSYCIVLGAYEAGIWMASPDKGFKFHHNIIADSKYAWVHNSDNISMVRSFNTCPEFT